jgi:hypothetical protein
MKPLTVFEAEAEARWRWGSLFAQGIARYSSGLRLPFEVGEKQRFGPIKIRGRGTSWEAAFSNADVLTNQETSKKPAGPAARSGSPGGRSGRLP